ncbi:hypothetical protein GCM10007933_33580 [Zoogloea oryzae]|uniref:DUF4062 domain-containing protein n=1 Tax=Zoogloea oryzae TaxID=310767 RepID=A0ABQ6FE82_9RHOO|nr:DUF4062 domain-containing protein [Zoogloea oryzae]GLT23887.1 hypothetical protein GCM10007933_33580 [Zoogloea oryzae]
MPHEADIPEIRQIFLSATAQDCRTYREAVRDFIHDNIEQAKVFLQENWAEGGQFVEDVCKRKVDECDAYMGLFGYRYGWIPPNRQYSITELEFRWAVDRWGPGEAPIFVLRPIPGSEADQHLRDQADVIHAKQPVAEAAADRAAQQQFLARVDQWAGSGIILAPYRNQLQLVGKALSCIKDWNQELLRRAPRERFQAPGDINRDELGRIGRKTQIDALQDALNALRDRRSERAAAFLIHGPANHGQPEFVEFLRNWDDEWDDMDICYGQPTEPDSAESLICWACSQLGEPLLGEPTIDALAGLLATRLAGRSVVLILRTVGREANRLALFQQRFWQPLHDALASRCAGWKGRLYCFIADHAPLAEPPPAGFRTDDIAADDVDYRQILALPPLGQIAAHEVCNWLKALRKRAGVRLDEDECYAIANYATTTGGNPPDVYYYLNLHGFWSRAR